MAKAPSPAAQQLLKVHVSLLYLKKIIWGHSVEGSPPMALGRTWDLGRRSQVQRHEGGGPQIGDCAS